MVYRLQVWRFVFLGSRMGYVSMGDAHRWGMPPFQGWVDFWGLVKWTSHPGFGIIIRSGDLFTYVDTEVRCANFRAFYWRK